MPSWVGDACTFHCVSRVDCTVTVPMQSTPPPPLCQPHPEHGEPVGQDSLSAWVRATVVGCSPLPRLTTVNRQPERSRERPLPSPHGAAQAGLPQPSRSQLASSDRQGCPEHLFLLLTPFGTCVLVTKDRLHIYGFYIERAKGREHF